MGVPGCVGTGVILPELREGPLGCASNTNIGLGTDAREGLWSRCEMGVLGQGVLKRVGPWLLTEDPGAKGWENRKACGSAGAVKMCLQTGSGLGETEESKATPTARR